MTCCSPRRTHLQSTDPSLRRNSSAGGGEVDQVGAWEVEDGLRCVSGLPLGHRRHEESGHVQEATERGERREGQLGGFARGLRVSV